MDETSEKIKEIIENNEWEDCGGAQFTCNDWRFIIHVDSMSVSLEFLSECCGSVIIHDYSDAVMAAWQVQMDRMRAEKKLKLDAAVEELMKLDFNKKEVKNTEEPEQK